MARQALLLRLAREVAAATAAADWTALAALDCQMASVLPAMAAQGAWTAAERAALAALRQQHREAVQKVGATSAGLAVHLQQMNTQKEGWLAYALDNDFAGIQA